MRSSTKGESSIRTQIRGCFAFQLLFCYLYTVTSGATAYGEGKASASLLSPNEKEYLSSTARQNLKHEVKSQFATLQKSIIQFKKDAKTRRRWEMIASQTFHSASLIVASDRDPADILLRRTEALLAHLTLSFDTLDLSVEKNYLTQLKDKNTSAAVEDDEARFEVFRELFHLRRRIAFSNPLLNFDRILYIKRQFLPESRSWGSDMLGNHMCDQYFGFHAIPGGGLYILENPFGKKPTVRNVLANSVVLSGRLKGRKLEPGNFLSPELSFDGKTIFFAYTEAEPTRYEWTKKSTFHIFKVNVDGTGLMQLTDGSVNDFDPCLLPDGQIVFISERRGGYGRCHPRPVPLYTLHSMNPDGSDIVRLSHHEANEWHPSVDHNGMILYSRWDYVDRGNIQAHHPWITAPDGHNARAIQGNFGKSKQARPTMELDVRAIPDSHKYIATAAAHHSQAYGSLVLIDPHLEDDDAMGPLRRITPEVPFTEAEIRYNEGQVYATAWPLSEYFYLCVYDAEGSARRGTGNNYGIYLADAFGNQELIYRDPSISCLSPIPLRSRKKPPVFTGMTASEEPSGDSRQTALAGVVNVNHSLKPFPKGTTITALRIIQVLPKTTPLIDEPRIGYGSEKGARSVLGTVPVESDGSAFFRLPVDTPVYFQALDEEGLAVQSMRSDTYVRPGQRLFCQGCHEPRTRTPVNPKTFPLAFRRKPSRIKPEVDGSNPFSFPRLVQPVLERNCVSCHEQDDQAIDLGKGDWKRNPEHVYTSYRNLQDYAFFYGRARYTYDPWTTPRTIPGEFGARASKLYRILRQDHYDLRLSKEDLHRITLWLDCNSDFFGSYEQIEAQAQGKVVPPTLE